MWKRQTHGHREAEVGLSRLLDQKPEHFSVCLLYTVEQRSWVVVYSLKRRWSRSIQLSMWQGYLCYTQLSKVQLYIYVLHKQLNEEAG